jgi:hypothetical protein
VLERFAHQDPAQKIVHDAYMIVRSRLAAVKQWITDRIGDLVDGKTASPEKTFAFWWMRNRQLRFS